MLDKIIDESLYPCLELVTKQGVQFIKKDLSSLSKREKEVYKMRNYKMLSIQEISDNLNVSKSTVQTYINRAKKKLNEV